MWSSVFDRLAFKTVPKTLFFTFADQNGKHFGSVRISNRISWMILDIFNSLLLMSLSLVLASKLPISILYYSKFDKGQTFNFFCRRSCLSDSKKFMIDM